MENMSTASENQSQQVNGLPIKQIVVAVNLSACSEKTVAYAIAIARSFEARIHLVYVQANESITESTTEGDHKYLEQERRDPVQEISDLFKRTRMIYPNCRADLRVVTSADDDSWLARNSQADLRSTASHYP